MKDLRSPGRPSLGSASEVDALWATTACGRLSRELQEPFGDQGDDSQLGGDDARLQIVEAQRGDYIRRRYIEACALRRRYIAGELLTGDASCFASTAVADGRRGSPFPIRRTNQLRRGTLDRMLGTEGWARLAGRDNALNYVRLLLACGVIVGHGYVLGYGQPPPIPAISEHAVDGFFAISGFLIAGSRARLGMGSFLWRRAVRIYPGCGARSS